MPIDTPIQAAFVGALVGSAGSFAVRWWFRWRKAEQKRDTIRLMLLTEMKSLRYLDFVAEEDWEQSALPQLGFLNTDVYHDNFRSIGTLSEAEVEAIVHFYGIVDALSHQSDLLTNATFDGQSVTESFERDMRENIEKAAKHRKIVSELLEKKRRGSTEGIANRVRNLF